MVKKALFGMSSILMMFQAFTTNALAIGGYIPEDVRMAERIASILAVLALIVFAVFIFVFAVTNAKAKGILDDKDNLDEGCIKFNRILDLSSHSIFSLLVCISIFFGIGVWEIEEFFFLGYTIIINFSVSSYIMGKRSMAYISMLASILLVFICLLPYM